MENKVERSEEVKKEPKTDSEKLELLATWFDFNDWRIGNRDREVQKDLRRIAEDLRKDSQSEIESLRKQFQKDIIDRDNSIQNLKQRLGKIASLEDRVKFLEGSKSNLKYKQFKKGIENLKKIVSNRDNKIKELESKLAAFENSDNYVLGHADGFVDGYSTRSNELSPKEEQDEK